MPRWLNRIGVFCLVLGLLLTSPLSDLMPVDVLHVINQPALSGHFRVVLAEDSSGHIGVALAFIGLMFLLAALIVSRRGS